MLTPDSGYDLPYGGTVRKAAPGTAAHGRKQAGRIGVTRMRRRGDDSSVTAHPVRGRLC